MKKLVLYTSKDCEHCEDARSVVSEVATEQQVGFVETDVTKVPSEHRDVPTVCIVDEEGKEECVTGFTDKEAMKRQLEKLLGKTVV